MVKSLNSPEIRQFIQKNSKLFWYIPEDKKENVSLGLLVETILNYGDLDNVKELFSIVGIKKVDEVLTGVEGRKKLNYFPVIYNYFTLVMNKYAQGNS